MTSDFLVHQKREVMWTLLAITLPNCVWRFSRQTEVTQFMDSKTVLVGETVKV